jgi:hypothetical protein
MSRKKNVKKPVKEKETLLVDESITIHRKKGNGVIRRQVWVNSKNEVTRYSLAYINYYLFHGDNGRVLSYDNAHHYHHKHYMGNIKPVVFTCFDDIENQFQREFEVLHEKAKKR